MWKYVWVKKCVEIREILFKNWKLLFENINQTPPQFWSNTQAYHRQFNSGCCEWCQCPTSAILDMWCFVLRKKWKLLLHRVILLDVQGLPLLVYYKLFLKDDPAEEESSGFHSMAAKINKVTVWIQLKRFPFSVFFFFFSTREQYSHDFIVKKIRSIHCLETIHILFMSSTILFTCLKIILW